MSARENELRRRSRALNGMAESLRVGDFDRARDQAARAARVTDITLGSCTSSFESAAFSGQPRGQRGRQVWIGSPGVDVVLLGRSIGFVREAEGREGRTYSRVVMEFRSGAIATGTTRSAAVENGTWVTVRGRVASHDIRDDKKVTRLADLIVIPLIPTRLP